MRYSMQMNDKYFEKFLGLFFRLFNGHIERVNIEANKITGVISYEDESGKQAFSWNKSNLNITADAIKLLEYIINKNLVRGDKIILSKENLVSELKKIDWKENEANNSINLLLNIKIRMIDDGIETDSFFHF